MRFVLSLICWATSTSNVRGVSYTEALQTSRPLVPLFRRDVLPTPMQLRGGGWTASKRRKGATSLDAAAKQPPRDDHVNKSRTTKIMVTKERTALATARLQRRNLIASSVLGLFLVATAVHFRSSWLPYFNKQAIQDKTLSLLRKLRNGEDAADAPASFKSMLFYALGLMVWEAFGLSTIPVETAAGMVFRFHEAALSSISGKILGAWLAFLAGRTVLAASLDSNKTISTNQLFVLLRKKNTHHPILTALLMKFSIFPELIKNLGCAVLPQIKLWMFIGTTLLHGGSFSLIWTWLGTSIRLNDTTRTLRVALTICGFIACVLTPLTMAWWIRALQSMSQDTKQLSSGLSKEPTTLKQRIDAYLIRPTSLIEVWLGGLLLASIGAILMTNKVV